MASLTEAIIALRPGVDFANTDGTLKGIRWDTPGVTPPTQAEVDEAMATLANRTPPTPEEKLAASTGLTVAELKALVAGK